MPRIPSTALLVVVTMVVLAVSSRAVSPPPPKVETPSGVVLGLDHGPTHAFLGIPYAQPPVGTLRWKPPAPLAPWSEALKAQSFGPRCAQNVVWKDMIFRDANYSEDCLTLNVWTPAAAPAAKLPVMVWIYGGGFQVGGTSEARQDGSAFAAKGVVAVTLNYRLGVFGFFAHPELMVESEHHAAGNYGLLDQVAALHWVQDNIAAFGGDPKNVTIFGESAGSYSVSALMASPLAKGLFARAIGESGAAFSQTVLAFSALSQVAADDAAYAESSLGTKDLAALRALSTDKLLDIAEKGPGHFRFVPIVDGYFLPDSVPALFAAGRQNDVPLLAGWNRDEHGIKEATPASLAEYAQKEFGPDAATFLKLFPASNDAQATRSLADSEAARFIGLSTWRWIEAATKTGKQPVYRYSFDLPPPEDEFHKGGLTAYHSGEIPYVFGSLKLLANRFAWRDKDRVLSEQMQKYWVNFARTGNPNGLGLPTWPAYSPGANAQIMHLDATSKARPDDTRQRYAFEDSHEHE